MSEAAIDAQFNRAVDIVQSLPKGGPVQTSYDEKLCLYSLYKQATEGDIKTARPGMLDLLGRAKWDSWHKHRGTDKTMAKQRYVAALLKILRKHSGRDEVRDHITEIEAFTGPRRVPSSASSSSSYHSSQASPPDSTTLYNQYLPPDPQMPIPDVAPDIVPPSALNSSHRSLLNLLQNPVDPSSSHHLAGSSSGVPPPRQPSARAESERGKGSISSLRYIRPNGAVTPAASHLGSVHEAPVPSGSRPYSPLMPAVRDFGTPDMTSASHLGVNPLGYPRPQASPSIYSNVHPAIPQTLQQIQISLTAIHERLSTLERTQAMIMRRDAKRRGWRLFGFGNEADELDELEDEAYKASAGWRTNTASLTRRRAPARSLSIRAVWMLMTAIRRVMVDLSIGVLLGIVVVVALGGGWQRARRTLTRIFLRSRRFIQES